MVVVLGRRRRCRRPSPAARRGGRWCRRRRSRRSASRRCRAAAPPTRRACPAGRRSRRRRRCWPPAASRSPPPGRGAGRCRSAATFSSKTLSPPWTGPCSSSAGSGPIGTQIWRFLPLPCTRSGPAGAESQLDRAVRADIGRGLERGTVEHHQARSRPGRRPAPAGPVDVSPIPRGEVADPARHQLGAGQLDAGRRAPPRRSRSGPRKRITVCPSGTTICVHAGQAGIDLGRRRAAGRARRAGRGRRSGRRPIPPRSTASPTSSRSPSSS